MPDRIVPHGLRVRRQAGMMRTVAAACGGILLWLLLPGAWEDPQLHLCNVQNNECERSNWIPHMYIHSMTVLRDSGEESHILRTQNSRKRGSTSRRSSSLDETRCGWSVS
jgi:hypothetical protein